MAFFCYASYVCISIDRSYETRGESEREREWQVQMHRKEREREFEGSFERWFSSSLLNPKEQLIQAGQHTHTHTHTKLRGKERRMDCIVTCGTHKLRTDRETHRREGGGGGAHRIQQQQQQVARFRECGAGWVEI
jgi:hypothetical protein